MNAYIRRGIAMLNNNKWDPNLIEKKAISTAKEIKKECKWIMKQKEMAKERHQRWAEKINKKLDLKKSRKKKKKKRLTKKLRSTPRKKKTTKIRTQNYLKTKNSLKTKKN